MLAASERYDRFSLFDWSRSGLTGVSSRTDLPSSDAAGSCRTTSMPDGVPLGSREMTATLSGDCRRGRICSSPRRLPADHQNREVPWYRRPEAFTPAVGRTRRGWLRRSPLEAHGEDVIGPRVERDRARADHGLEILLHLACGRPHLLHHGERAVAVRAERFHRRGIKDGTIGSAG